MHAKIRNESLGRNLVAQIGVLDVFHYADDFHVGVRTWVITKTEMHAERIATGKEATGKCLVNDDGGGSPGVLFGSEFYFAIVGHTKIVVCDKGDTESGKIVGTDHVHERVRSSLRGGRRVAFDGHAAVPFIVFEDANASQTH